MLMLIIVASGWGTKYRFSQSLFEHTFVSAVEKETSYSAFTLDDEINASLIFHF